MDSKKHSTYPIFIIVFTALISSGCVSQAMNLEKSFTVAAGVFIFIIFLFLSFFGWDNNEKTFSSLYNIETYTGNEKDKLKFAGVSLYTSAFQSKKASQIKRMIYSRSTGLTAIKGILLFFIFRAGMHFLVKASPGILSMLTFMTLAFFQWSLLMWGGLLLFQFASLSIFLTLSVFAKDPNYLLIGATFGLFLFLQKSMVSWFWNKISYSKYKQSFLENIFSILPSLIIFVITFFVTDYFVAKNNKSYLAEGLKSTLFKSNPMKARNQAFQKELDKNNLGLAFKNIPGLTEELRSMPSLNDQLKDLQNLEIKLEQAIKNNDPQAEKLFEQWLTKNTQFSLDINKAIQEGKLNLNDAQLEELLQNDSFAQMNDVISTQGEKVNDLKHSLEEVHSLKENYSQSFDELNQKKLADLQAQAMTLTKQLNQKQQELQQKVQEAKKKNISTAKEKVKNAKKNEEDKNDFSFTKFTNFLIIVCSIIVLIYIFKKIFTKKVEKDDTQQFDHYTKSEIQKILKERAPSFTDFSEEVDHRYKTFHKVIETGFYGEDKAPPGMILSDSEFTEIPSTLMGVNKNLAPSFNKVHFEKESNFDKNEINNFRGAYKRFEQYFKYL